MKSKAKASPAPFPVPSGLVEPLAAPSDDGLSLEELTTAYAELLQRGQTPYEETATPPDTHPLPEESLFESNPLSTADLGCDLTPKSILEAMLFVGNSTNQGFTSRQIAALMRGVRPQEIDELVRELNASYAAEGCPYAIVSVGAGYRMQLREQYAALRDQFHGRVRDAKLTQPAIDVLAIVAYRQPIPRENIDQIRGQPSGSILSQLVRRGLLRIDHEEKGKKGRLFRTTDRFLELFGLDGLAELPLSQEGLPEE